MRTALIAILMLAGTTARADDDQLRKQIVGMWTLVSVVYEDPETKARTPVLGEKPRGRQIATADGRWLALVTAEGRPVPKTDEQRARALQTMIAYTGQYRVENGRVITKVEAPGTRHGSAANRSVSSASRATACSSKARRCRIPMSATRS